MTQPIQAFIGILLIVIGTVFFFIPGTVLLQMVGLVIVCRAWPPAQEWTRRLMRTSSRLAYRLDRYRLRRKHVR